jgi:sugar phosphate isomerase/epimerase
VIKGPAILLTQFLGDRPPFDTLENISGWAKNLGYLGIQIPVDSNLIDLDKAAESKGYCDDLKGRCNGLEITELSSHPFGQLVAVHPAYDELFDSFAVAEVRGNPSARSEWAVGQMIKSIRASRNLGLDTTCTFSGSLLWPYLYPWPPRAEGLVDLGFEELAARWLRILTVAEELGVDLAFEIHPGEDLHDGVTFERFRTATNNHARVAITYDPSHFVLQHIDYLGFIERYGEHIRAFHVKDAEFNSNPRCGVYGGYLDWRQRPGRFRSLGDGQVDFRGVFTRLTQAGYASWAVMEWECCLKSAEQGAREGAPFIRSLLIETADKSFDEFAATQADPARLRRIIGLDRSPPATLP